MAKWEMSPLRPSWIEVEIDGVLYSGREVKDIHRAFQERRTADGGRVVPGDEDRVWQAIKDAYPKFIIKTKRPGKSGLSIGAAWSFLRFVEKRIRNKTLVASEEAQRRTGICNACPQRSHVSGCVICKEALGLFVKPPVKLEPRPPESCLACGCYLPLKVWVPREVLGSPQEFDYSETCWMRETAALSPEPEPAGS